MVAKIHTFSPKTLNLLDIFSTYYLTTINSNKIRNTIVKKLSNVENNKKIIQYNDCTCLKLNLNLITKIIASLESA